MIALKPAARLDLVEVTPKIEFDHVARSVARATRGRWFASAQSVLVDRQSIDKGINKPHGGILAHVVFDPLRQQQRLLAVNSSYKLHCHR